MATRVNSCKPKESDFILGFTDLHEDLMGQVFEQIVLNGDIPGIQALGCSSWHFQKLMIAMVDGSKLEKLCPMLKIISEEQARSCGFTAERAPPVPRFKMLHAYHTMTSHVEGNAGVTYFDITLEDMTFSQIVGIAKNQGIEVGIFWDQIVPEIGDVISSQEFPCLLANNVFNDSRNKTYEEQTAFVKGVRCAMPMIEQYVIQIVLAQKILNLTLFGQDPFTYGRTSTLVQGFPLVVGGTVFNSLAIYRSLEMGIESYGIGGRRNF